MRSPRLKTCIGSTVNRKANSLIKSSKRGVNQSASSSARASSANKSKKKNSPIKYKYTVKGMFDTIKQKQLTSSHDLLASTPKMSDQVAASTSSAPSTPSTQLKKVTRRNLFGIRLNHDQLNRDLKEMWQEQMEKQKTQWNFDFEKLKPVEAGGAVEQADRIMTRTRTRSISMCEREEPVHSMPAEKRYRWKRVSTSIESNDQTKLPTMSQPFLIQPQGASTPLSTPLNTKKDRSLCNFGMAVSAIDPNELGDSSGGSCDNQNTVYIYHSDEDNYSIEDELSSGSNYEESEEEDEALAVPQFYKYQRILKLNQMRRSPLVFYHHKGTNTTPSISLTNQQLAADQLGSVDQAKKDKIVKRVSDKIKGKKSSARNKSQQQGLIITLSENRKDTLRSAAAQNSDSGYCKLRQPSILGRILGIDVILELSLSSRCLFKTYFVNEREETRALTSQKKLNKLRFCFNPFHAHCLPNHIFPRIQVLYIKLKEFHFDV